MTGKYARTEFERRFLFQHLPSEVDPFIGYTQIMDRYLIETDLRLRRMESPAGETLALKLAKKFKPPEAGPYETTITNLYLSRQEYDLLAQLSADLLVKRRYPYPFAGHTYSIDIFDGHLEGLALCEIEAFDLATLLAIKAPAGAVLEVTADPFFLGGNLARTSRHELESRLGELL